MIDTLLSEPNLPKYLKNHKDGKQIDHIYPYQDLLTNYDQIYHIGDSKYYKDTSITGQNAIAKQYTYAKNVIQFNIDVLNEKGELENKIRYRDELTEGYNITPNFFISAVLNEALDFQSEDLKHYRSFEKNKHFEDRLFDRDTLILQTYNINFLYVLKSYVSNNQTQINKFKVSAKNLFRKKIVEFLKDKYVFYEVKPEANLEIFVEQNFRFLSGKMYRPSGWEGRLLLALEKEKITKKLVLAGAYISEYEIGE